LTQDTNKVAVNSSGTVALYEVMAASTTSPTTGQTTTSPPTTASPSPTRSSTSGVSPAAPSSPGPTSAAGTVEVQHGQSFWSIAQEVEQKALGGAAPTTAQVSHYWSQLLAANAHRLPHPGHPDLIYPGETLILPAG
jgi:nucleoid-associated protein YgaU